MGDCCEYRRCAYCHEWNGKLEAHYIREKDGTPVQFSCGRTIFCFHPLCLEESKKRHPDWIYPSVETTGSDVA